MSSKTQSLAIKSLASLLIIAMVFLVFPYSSSAATSKYLKIFRVRQSTDGSSGKVVGGVQIIFFTDNTKQGRIVFTEDTEFYSQYLKDTVAFDKGTEYSFKISSLKEGASITLTYNPNTGLDKTGCITWGSEYGSKNLKTITGKIHMTKNGDFSTITKIDGFKKNGQKIGFYLRNN
jgi:hypothetical protein